MELETNCNCHLKQKNVRHVHSQPQPSGQQYTGSGTFFNSWSCPIDHRACSASLEHHDPSPFPGAHMATSQMPHHGGEPQPVYASSYNLWVPHPSLSAPPPRSHMTTLHQGAAHIPGVHGPIFYGARGGVISTHQSLPPPHPFVSGGSSCFCHECLHHGKLVYYPPYYTPATGSFPPPVVLSQKTVPQLETMAKVF